MFYCIGIKINFVFPIKIMFNCLYFDICAKHKYSFHTSYFQILKISKENRGILMYIHFIENKRINIFIVIIFTS